MQPFGILSIGMVTGVGLSASASCAAVRAGINGFRETGFDIEGQRLLGCQVPLEDATASRSKLLKMAGMAVSECLSGAGLKVASDIPVLLCLSELNRPGRHEGLDETFFMDLCRGLGLSSPVEPERMMIQKGSVGGVWAVSQAEKTLLRNRSEVLLVGVDSYLTPKTLASLWKERRLLCEQNSDGFIPGEAAAAVLLSSRKRDSALFCQGIGLGKERAAFGTGQPIRADGLVQAVKSCFSIAKTSYKTLDYRIVDLNGEYYRFKEASLLLTRTMRERKEEFDIWTPLDCVGEIGAAMVPFFVGVAWMAARKGYAPGSGVLCHFCGDGEDRAAMIFRGQEAR